MPFELEFIGLDGSETFLAKGFSNASKSCSYVFLFVIFTLYPFMFFQWVLFKVSLLWMTISFYQPPIFHFHYNSSFVIISLFFFFLFLCGMQMIL